ncbi:hypothetical protein CSA56_01660 [candidate division KSB3 bacterium]|uniref:Uncharacterized protein n=1 Tax=candidate division KSB3 bacterium TaxID=2044937 RepID=A0A2G6KMD8_9BACT|nr:MAG: hypothetical protein CSA56_01660 [candidate division KSB3 bacterium]
MAKKRKEKTIKASKLGMFLSSNTNKPVQVHIQHKQVDLTIQGDVHKHDHQYWITRENAMTIVELKQRGTWLSRLLAWPDKNYDMSVTITLDGETVAAMTLPLDSKQKLPCTIMQ